MAGAKAGSGVEVEGRGVGFADREGEGAVAAGGKMRHAVGQEVTAEAEAGVGRGDAELGDVRDVGSYTGAEEDGGELGGVLRAA